MSKSKQGTARQAVTGQTKRAALQVVGQIRRVTPGYRAMQCVAGPCGSPLPHFACLMMQERPDACVEACIGVSVCLAVPLPAVG